MDHGSERALGTVQAVNASAPSIVLSEATTEFGNQDISVVIATMTEAIFLLLIFVASVISNALVFIIFYQRPTLRSLSNRFVLNLALCELLYSVLVIPYVAVAVVTDGAAIGLLWCQLTKVVTVLLALGCVFSILSIAVDRYCAVMNPLHYNMTITRTRCSCMIIATWLLSFGFALLPLANLGSPSGHLQPLGSRSGVVTPAANESRLSGGHVARATVTQCDCWSTVTTVVMPAYRFWYSVVVSGLGFVFPLLLLCWSYACMYRAARDSSVRVRRHSVTMNPSEVILHEALGGNASSGECTPINQGSGGALLASHHHGLHTFKKTFYRRRSSNASVSVVFFREEGKAAQTGLLVVATYVCCWLPYFAFVLLEAQPDWKSVPTLGRTLAQHLTFVGCAVNPFVYVYRNRMVWKDARHLLHCRRTGNFNYALQRHLTKATPGGRSVMHHPFAGCINNNDNHFRHHQRLLNREVTVWRHGAAGHATKSLIRIAIEDHASSCGSLNPSVAMEAIRLESLKPERWTTHPTVANAGEPEAVDDRLASPDERCAIPESHSPLAASYTLRVETVRGSSWSLPNHNVSYFIQSDVKSVSDNEMRERKSPEPEATGCLHMRRTITPTASELQATDADFHNNNINNNNKSNYTNNNYDNRHHHNRTSSPRNLNHPSTRCHPSTYLTPLAIHPTYHSSTISLLRVNHPTHSSSGTTL